MTDRQAEVVDATATDLVLYDHNLFPELKWADPEDMGQRFADRFKRAESVDDLFDVLQGNNTKGMVGRRLEIQAVEWQAFQSDRGVIPNAICLAADVDSGEVLEFATTSMFCAMFIRRAELIDALPLKVKITSTKTRSGQTAINFEKV
jgi:hypothetical protein